VYEFEWDAEKATANIKKHGVSFEEAQSVFLDIEAPSWIDDRHSDDEVREIMIGHSLRQRLLFVCYTERDERIRIISAREATPHERRAYENEATDW
jgi:uncharacterized DUF497 family protein